VAFGFVAGMLGWIAVSRDGHSGLGFWRGERRAETAALLHFGKWQGTAQLAGTIGNQIDRYALASLAPLAVVGHYNVANRLQEAAYIGVVKSAEVLFPRFGSMSSSHVEQRQSFFQVSSWVVGVFSAMVLAPLVPLADATLRLWVGPQAAEGAGLMLRTLVLGGVVGAGSNVFLYYAMGMGRTSVVAILSSVYSVLTVVTTVLLLRLFGPQAAGAGLLLASVVRIALGLHLTRRDFFPGLRWRELFASTALPIVCGCAVAVLLDAADVFKPAGWIALGIDYALVAAAVLLATVVVTALGGGRPILAQAWRSLRAAAGR
jgi:O-antigen/teichoic acid export membrane protein